MFGITHVLHEHFLENISAHAALNNLSIVRLVMYFTFTNFKTSVVLVRAQTSKSLIFPFAIVIPLKTGVRFSTA